MGIDTQLVRYQDGDVDLSGMFVWDEAQTEKRPGILVVHGGAGLDEHAKKQATRLAELGYIAFACDMYGDGVMGDRQRVMARITELCAEPGRLSRRGRPVWRCCGRIRWWMAGWRRWGIVLAG